MSTVHEIESAMQKLIRTELEQMRAWLEDYLEDQMEFTDEFKASIERDKQDRTALRSYAAGMATGG